jgi:lipoyl(octanoyl) transferase
VTLHGFALNVNNDLAAFQTIVPCGLRHAGVTSVATRLGTSCALPEMAERLVRAFERSFGMRLARISASSSRLQIANGNL